MADEQKPRTRTRQMCALRRRGERDDRPKFQPPPPPHSDVFYFCARVYNPNSRDFASISGVPARTCAPESARGRRLFSTSSLPSLIYSTVHHSKKKNKYFAYPFTSSMHWNNFAERVRLLLLLFI